MSVESATFVTDLVVTNPVHTDPLSQADSHMRLIKQVLLNTFPHLNGAVEATVADLSIGHVPVGGIILWAGTAASVPAGWRICDGTFSTPNLSQRFVYAAGGGLAVNQVGGDFLTTSDGNHTHTGAATDVSSGHTHNTTSTGGGTGSTDGQGTHSHSGATQSHALTIPEIPPHNHFGGGTLFAPAGSFWNSIPLSTTVSLFTQVEATTGGGAGHTHGISADGNHAHSVSVGVTVSGTSDLTGQHAHVVDVPVAGIHQHSAVPPYYSLYYIIRVT
jgi:hypothetical protein